MTATAAGNTFFPLFYGSVAMTAGAGIDVALDPLAHLATVCTASGQQGVSELLLQHLLLWPCMLGGMAAGCCLPIRLHRPWCAHKFASAAMRALTSLLGMSLGMITVSLCLTAFTRSISPRWQIEVLCMGIGMALGLAGVRAARTFFSASYRQALRRG